tara:strand:- start:589 stop:1443 length:855 start_codon:yes stop_codon:yes gene_type:complete
MSTLGQKPATQHVSLQKQTITGNGGTSYSLQQSVSSALDIAVFVNNTRQEPAVAYSATGTTLTMTGAVNASDHFYVLFLGKAITTTGLPVDTVATANINANAITAAKLHDDAVTHAKLPSGSTLQVKQSIFRGNYNFNDASYQDITNLSVAITPSSTSNKILIECVLCASSNANQRFGVRIVRDGSMILPPIDFAGQGAGGSGVNLSNRTLAHVFGDGRGSNAPTQPSVIKLLDTPSSTSSLTYKVQAFCEASSYLYINQCQTFSDDATKFGAVSTLTVSEIAG